MTGSTLGQRGASPSADQVPKITKRPRSDTQDSVTSYLCGARTSGTISLTEDEKEHLGRITTHGEALATRNGGDLRWTEFPEEGSHRADHRIWKKRVRGEDERQTFIVLFVALLCIYLLFGLTKESGLGRRWWRCHNILGGISVPEGSDRTADDLLLGAVYRHHRESVRKRGPHFGLVVNSVDGGLTATTSYSNQKLCEKIGFLDLAEVSYKDFFERHGIPYEGAFTDGTTKVILQFRPHSQELRQKMLRSKL
uniref:N-acetylmuramoyl-L-alanine amidase domain-containing protein n=1 Tax=Steinernema glaseri TaxID=37863 RepID=A0A1I7Z063_9BILA